MGTKIFVNLAVKNLRKSIAFFTNLGFSFNHEFTDDTATCMIIGPDSNVMLLTEEKFRSFTPKPISEATISSEVLICISLDSREAIDAMVKMAVAEGGSLCMPVQDHGFMYGHSFQDLDGHIWELIHMDPVQFKN